MTSSPLRAAETSSANQIITHLSWKAVLRVVGEQGGEPTLLELGKQEAHGESQILPASGVRTG